MTLCCHVLGKDPYIDQVKTSSFKSWVIIANVRNHRIMWEYVHDRLNELWKRVEFSFLKLEELFLQIFLGGVLGSKFGFIFQQLAHSDAPVQSISVWFFLYLSLPAARL